MQMMLGHTMEYWLRLEEIMQKYRLTEKDLDRVDGALSAIRNQGIEERVLVIEKHIGIAR